MDAKIRQQLQGPNVRCTDYSATYLVIIVNCAGRQKK